MEIILLSLAEVISLRNYYKEKVEGYRIRFQIANDDFRVAEERLDRLEKELLTRINEINWNL